MAEDIRGFYDEIQSVNIQVSLLLDRLLNPNANGLTVTVADVQALMRVRALLPKMARIAEFLESIGIDIVPDPSRVCGFFFDISRLEFGDGT